MSWKETEGYPEGTIITKQGEDKISIQLPNKEPFMVVLESGADRQVLTGMAVGQKLQLRDGAWQKMSCPHEASGDRHMQRDLSLDKKVGVEVTLRQVVQAIGIVVAIVLLGMLARYLWKRPNGIKSYICGASESASKEEEEESF